MRYDGIRNLRRTSMGVLLSMLTVQTAVAQARRVLPDGTVILVNTRQALESQTIRAGQTFDTDVIDTLAVDGYTVVPAGSRIRGVVTYVQPATRSRSGVIEVSFDRMTLTAGDRIRAAQRELARLSYYRGAANGQLDDATQRALVEYQIDKGLVATGNLDWRTARSLGVLTSVSGGEVATKTALTPEEAASL